MFVRIHPEEECEMSGREREQKQEGTQSGSDFQPHSLNLHRMLCERICFSSDHLNHTRHPRAADAALLPIV